MRVLLIQSYTMIDEAPLFPLGLSYIAGSLKGHEVDIFDMNLEEEPYQALEKKIYDFNPDIVGLSIRNIKVARPGSHLSCFEPHELTIKLIKKLRPHTPLMLGGSAFSLYAEEIMCRVPSIDMGVLGEGEDVVPELLDNLSNPENVKGLYLRNGDSIVFTGRRDWLKFEDIPAPRRDICKIDRYKVDPTSIGVQTKRGCILQCLHCSDSYLVGKTLRLRSPQKVVDEIDELASLYNVEEIMFADQVFNIPLEHAMEICNEIIKRGIKIKWTAWFNEKYITEEFLNLCKKSGCTMISFSPDSVSDNILKKLHKNITTRDIENAYRIARRCQIPVSFNFMVNAPGENLFSLIKLLTFLLKAKFHLGRFLKLHGLFIVPIRIYPHTEILSLAVREGLLKEETDLIEAVFYDPPGPLKYLGHLLLKSLSLAWNIKHFGDKKNGAVRKRQSLKHFLPDKKATV